MYINKNGECQVTSRKEVECKGKILYSSKKVIILCENNSIVKYKKYAFAWEIVKMHNKEIEMYSKFL